MRKLITIAALLLVAATAQGQSKYDNGYKYGLLSNLEVGVGGIYSYEITNAQHQKNAGAQLLVTKRIGDYWRIRGVAEVNGFIPNKFDRFGKGMLGISFDLLPFYLYADYGANLNPSSKSKFGLAMDGGIGLQFRLGTASLYVEGGVDRTNNGTKWQSNAEVKAGVMVNCGTTEDDDYRLKHDKAMRSEYGELRTENQILRTEAQKMQDTNEQLTLTLDRATKLCAQLEEKLNTCTEEKQAIEKNCGNGEFMPIFFRHASSEMLETERPKLQVIANKINAGKGTYRVDGYCSNDGDVYRNQVLSENRAWEVVMTLVNEYGCEMSKFEIVEGHGKSNIYGNDLDKQVVITRIK